MNTVQRQFGKLTHRGGGDDAKVSVLLQEFEDADKMLTKIIDASKSWRDSWVSILTVQLGVLNGFEELYNPIIGTTSDSTSHEPTMTPQVLLDRSRNLQQAYTELKADLMDEVNMMDVRIIRPAMDAKEYIQPIKKTIKKRENKRLDYERHFDKVTSAAKKPRRTDKDEVALAKAEVELSKATDEFKVADAHLRDTLPPLVTAVFAILPHLLAAQILIQNTLLAQYYTTLHNYCQDEGFPSPSPPMEDVIAQWNADFKPIQKEVESLNPIARGKVVHTSMVLDDPSNRKSGTVTGLNIRNNVSSHIPGRRPSSQMMITGPKSPSARPTENRIARIPSSGASPSLSRNEYEDAEQEPDRDSHLSPAYTPRISHSPGGPTRDYFSRSRQPSQDSLQEVASPALSAIAVKKKPPPPPPKRLSSYQKEIWVTALYSFDGQEAGDLSFREGDRIKVVKKTASTDDWWDGELRGHRGRFPANYCEMNQA